MFFTAKYEKILFCSDKKMPAQKAPSRLLALLPHNSDSNMPTIAGFSKFSLFF
jgi:hypothetical protein